ncbi:MAG: hypothetical protein PHI11_01600 [Gallionella sp.]|nr:hypothetical protein [Gallionella sp.]
MPPLNTDYFVCCIATLERALTLLNANAQDDLMFDIYRAACVKEFEIIL